MQNINIPFLPVPGTETIQQFFTDNWPALLLLVIWSLIWKGLALWKAARNSSKPWFILLLILNTAGILEIIYYFLIGDKKAA